MWEMVKVSAAETETAVDDGVETWEGLSSSNHVVGTELLKNSNSNNRSKIVVDVVVPADRPLSLLDDLVVVVVVRDVHDGSIAWYKLMGTKHRPGGSLLCHWLTIVGMMGRIFSTSPM